MNESIKEYLRRIGSKGGKAVAGTPQAKERAAKAAQARWAKLKHTLADQTRRAEIEVPSSDRVSKMVFALGCSMEEILGPEAVRKKASSDI